MKSISSYLLPLRIVSYKTKSYRYFSNQVVSYQKPQKLPQSQHSPSLPSQLSPLSSKTKLKVLEISENSFPEIKFKTGEEIKVKVVQFGPLGASVIVNGDNFTKGLISQDEISRYRAKNNNKDVILNEEYTAYVGKVREDGKINVSLRRLGYGRIEEAQEEILHALEGSPSQTIPVGDKSTPDSIASYFYGMSKSDFKSATGKLYKQGLLIPGDLETRLTTDEEKKKSKALAQLIEANPLTSRNVRTIQTKHTVFIGNLPIDVEYDSLRKLIVSKMSKESSNKDSKKDSDEDPIKSLRLVIDKETNKSKGYCFVEFNNESLFLKSIEVLKGLKMNGRILRINDANSDRTNSLKESKETFSRESTTTALESKPKSKPWAKSSEKNIDKNSSKTTTTSASALASTSTSQTTSKPNMKIAEKKITTETKKYENSKSDQKWLDDVLEL